MIRNPLPIKIPPGVYRNGTEYEQKGRWYDATQVRWYEGQMRPIGGWVQAVPNAVTGTARGVHTWRANDGSRWLAVGTEQGLWVWNGGTLYDITPAGFAPGRQDSILGKGYGAGPYGEEEYGTERTSAKPLEATTWSLSSWGENLIAVASHEGTIYEWAPDPLVAASQVTNSPTDVAGVFVTNEQALVALGGVDPRLVTWTDLRNNTVWTSTPTNQAGDQTLVTDGEIQVGYPTRGQHLILTNLDAHVMRFVGEPYIYGFDRIANACGIVGRRAGQLFDGRAAWMGRKSFFLFDGRVRPIPCSVSDYIFGDINRQQYAKVHTHHEPRFGEVWWHYCSAGSNEIDRYAIWNYREGHWSIGDGIPRLSWSTVGVWEHPHAVDVDGTIFEQENGWTADGVSRVGDMWARSGPIELGNGERALWLNQFIPDEKTEGDAQVRLFGRMTPEGDEVEFGPYPLSRYTDMRAQARQLAMQVEPVRDVDWRWGLPRISWRQGSRR